MRIPFNKPYLAGNEFSYMKNALESGKISGNGIYTSKCHEFFKNYYGFSSCLLTTSGTDALEMSALLADIGPGDEVIIPTYAFVSTANAFALRGATIRFCDSLKDHPNVGIHTIKKLITSKTKAVVVIHYAGIAVDMDPILALANDKKLIVIEDNAQGIDSYYKGKPLGGLGHLAAFSFHETKNIISGEGGLLVVNDKHLATRAEIIWEKGTNRASFSRGETKKYEWYDLGSSYLPSEITSAFLFAQLEFLHDIQAKRKKLYKRYFDGLISLEEKNHISLPKIPEFATNNAHIFYLVCNNFQERQDLLSFLKQQGILAVFHYLCLHHSPFALEHLSEKTNLDDKFPNALKYERCLIRLPMYYELSLEDQKYIIDAVCRFYS